MNILDEIVSYKLEQLKAQKAIEPFSGLSKALDRSLPESGFYKRLRQDGIGLIAEVKKASPSLGIIRDDFDVKAISLAYKNAGAACLSVLTEDKYFKGSLSYLDIVASTVQLPLLRKDFIIDEYQVYESKVHQAHAVLLIAAILKENDLKRFLKVSSSILLDVLVEVHNGDELDMALDCGATIIGINTRNLKDFSIDFDIIPKLLEKIPEDKLVICESGIKSVSDINMVKKFKVNAVLIGEALMRSKDIETTTSEFVRELKI